jgi:ParB/RepB/Spo0J family partition protein
MTTKTESQPSNDLVANFQKDAYMMVEPKLIIADETKNPRTDYGDIEELMNSILENGIRNPLKGYQKHGKITLKDGHRRMRAVKLALARGKKTEKVPVILEQRPMNEEERTLEYIIFNDGKPLTMLEQSEVINRLLNFGWKTADVVKKTGKVRGYIENLILLTRVPMKVTHAIREGKISAHAVIQIMQAVKGDAAKAALEIEVAMKNATQAGKEKATPKHVGTQKVKKQSFGKFYKWVEEIADELAGRKDILRAREEVLSKLMVCFENGQSAKQVLTYFLDPAKKAETIKVAQVKASLPVKKVISTKSPSATKKVKRLK